MAIKLTTNPDGSVTVTEDTQSKAADGSLAQTFREWRCANAAEAGRHVATWNDTSRTIGVDAKGAPIPAQPLSAGDVSAVMDAANELAKQLSS